MLMVMMFTGLITHCLLYPVTGRAREDAWEILKASYYLLLAMWVPVALLINVLDFEAAQLPPRHIVAIAIPGVFLLDVGCRRLRDISPDLIGTCHRLLLAIMVGLPLIPIIHYVLLAASSLMAQNQILS